MNDLWILAAIAAFLLWPKGSASTPAPAPTPTTPKVVVPPTPPAPGLTPTGNINPTPQNGGPALFNGPALQLASIMTAKSGAFNPISGASETLAFVQGAVVTSTSYNPIPPGSWVPGISFTTTGVWVPAGFPTGQYTVYCSAQDHQGVSRPGQFTLAVMA